MEFKKEFVKNNGKKVRLLAETQIEDSYGERQILRHAGYGRIVIDGQSFGIVYTDTQGMERSDIYLYGTEKQVGMERNGSATGILDFTLGKETLSRYYLEYGRTLNIAAAAVEKTDNLGHDIFNLYRKLNAAKAASDTLEHTGDPPCDFRDYGQNRFVPDGHLFRRQLPAEC